jgi:hypothetical protein
VKLGVELAAGLEIRGLPHRLGNALAIEPSPELAVVVLGDPFDGEARRTGLDRGPEPIFPQAVRADGVVDLAEELLHRRCPMRAGAGLFTSRA